MLAFENLSAMHRTPYPGLASVQGLGTQRELVDHRNQVHGAIPDV